MKDEVSFHIYQQFVACDHFSTCILGMFCVVSILVLEVAVLFILSGEVVQNLRNCRSNSMSVKLDIPEGPQISIHSPCSVSLKGASLPVFLSCSESISEFWEYQYAMKKHFVAMNNKNMESMSLSLDCESCSDQNITLTDVKYCLKIDVILLHSPHHQLVMLTRPPENLDISSKDLMILYK